MEIVDGMELITGMVDFVKRKLSGKCIAAESYVGSDAADRRDSVVTFSPGYRNSGPFPSEVTGIHHKYRIASHMMIPPANIYRLHGVRYTGTVNSGGLFVTPDNTILDDLSIGAASPVNKALREGGIPRCRKLPGTTVILSLALAADHYGHWICGMVPRLRLLREAGFRFEEVDHIVINHSGAPYQMETLRRYGVPEEKIIVDSERVRFRCERIMTTSLFFGSALESDRKYVLMHYPRWAYPFFPEESEAKRAGRERLYVSRHFFANRNVLNENEVLACVRRFGFREVFPEKLEFAEQIRLFGEAECVVAPHGSALANIVFCRKGASVIQLHSPRYVNTVYRDIAVAGGFDFYPLMGPGESMVTGEDDLVTALENNFAGITVDVNALENLLVRILPGPHKRGES